MSAPKTIYAHPATTWSVDQSENLHSQEYRLVDQSEPDPLEAVRADFMNECACEKKWAMSDFDGGTVNGLRFALEIIDKAKGVRGE